MKKKRMIISECSKFFTVEDFSLKVCWWASLLIVFVYAFQYLLRYIRWYCHWYCHYCHRHHHWWLFVLAAFIVIEGAVQVVNVKNDLDLKELLFVREVQEA